MLRAMRRTGPLISPLLVGRDDLLDLADRRLTAALGGAGHLLFLAGEAGIGKTRLLGAIERRAAATGFRVVRAASFPRDLEVAAAPLLDLARTMTRTDPFRELGQALVERLAEIDLVRDGDAHRRRRMFVLDVVDLLVSLASQPTLLALADLHWADDLSLEILAGLARRLPELPVVVVATYRSDELYPRIPMREWRARLLTQRLAEEARLPRLSLEETAKMTTLILDTGMPAPQDVVEAVHDRTDGIPLHVEEFLGVLWDDRRSGREAIRAANVPDTLEEAVLERIAGRSARARSLARAGAVIGRSFDVDLLAGVAGEPLERLTDPLHELVSHFFLVAAEEPGRYDFRHALIRDAIYGQVPTPERRRLHRRVADLAAERGGESEAFLSIHYEHAGRSEDAYRTALAGARWAAAISSHREAFELYRRALRNAPDGLTPVEHARVLEEFAAEAAATDDNATASDAYAEARDRYLSAGAVREAAAVIGPLVPVRHLLGDALDARTALLRRGLDELRETPPDQENERLRCRLLAGLANAYMIDRLLDASIEHGEEARRLAVAVGDEPTELAMLGTLGFVHLFAGRADEGWALLEEGVRRAREGRLEAEAARCYRLIGAAASYLVEYDRGERWLREGIEYAERVERWNDRHYMTAHLGLVLWATGRWDEATRVAEHALADGRGGITTRITALYVLGYVALGRGDWPRARTFLSEALGLGEGMREIGRLSPPLWGLAETALLAGEPALATELCERRQAVSAAVVDAGSVFQFLVTGTRAHLALGDPAGAERWVEAIAQELHRRSIPGTLAAIDHGRGLVLLAGGSTGRARQALEAAMRAWDARAQVWEGTWARLDLASCLLRMNRSAEAVALLDDVRSIADRLGSRPLATRAGELLRSARTRHLAGETWSPLTVREFEVARLIAAGHTNPEIAETLGIAPKTVSAHVEHILAKLGASRRAEVAAWTATIARLDDGHGGGQATAGRLPRPGQPPVVGDSD